MSVWVRAGLGTTVLAAAFAACLGVGGSLVAARHHRVPAPPTHLRAETLSIESLSGETLAAWLIVPPDPHAAAVVLHGLHADRGAMLGRAELLWARGYAVLLPDLQGHGESTGDRTTLGHLEGRDVLSCVNELRRRFPSLPVVGIGVSLGGAALSLAGSELPLSAAVLEAVYPTIEDAVENRVAMRVGPLSKVLSPLLLLQLRPRLGVDPATLRPIEAVRTMRYPLLIVSGRADRHTTESQTRALFAAAHDPKELWLVAGAAHVDLLRVDPEGYRSHVIGFLERCVAGS